MDGNLFRSFWTIVGLAGIAGWELCRTLGEKLYGNFRVNHFFSAIPGLFSDAAIAKHDSYLYDHPSGDKDLGRGVNDGVMMPMYRGMVNAHTHHSTHHRTPPREN